MSPEATSQGARTRVVGVDVARALASLIMVFVATIFFKRIEPTFAKVL